MRVVLFALTGFGNKVLDALLAESCEVGFILTRREKGPFPYYREKNLAAYAKEKGIAVYDDFNWDMVEEKIKEFSPQLLLISTFHKIIPPNIIDAVPLAVNMHPALLPRYRGATPVDAVLFNREKETGVTAHRLTKDLDAGDILIQKKMTIEAGDTKNSVMRKLAIQTAKVARKLVQGIKTNTLRSRSQLSSAATHIPKFNSQRVLFVLGGVLRKDRNGRWQTSTFTGRGDAFGVTGDRLRVLAARNLYHAKPNVGIITVGGKGQLRHIPHAPPVSRVLKDELIKLKVPRDAIWEENESSNTYSQLQKIKQIITRHALRKAIVVSNTYHLPRIKAFIERDGALKKMLQNGRISLRSAERVLIKDDPKRWKERIGRAYKSVSMKNRIAMEKKGVESIKKGTYQLR